ncbi:MAG TPA: enoyl-CoA hydratase-related protein [Candidatus Thermoplasmatota archaeon]|nr:enoyl-CoA hydratase-related protein [Candidatus Thermoplasmatota archaeon]
MARDLKPQDAGSFGFEDILYSKADWVATVTFNRPRVYNSYRTQTLIELREAFRDATVDDAVAVIVLTGAGDKAFCTGGDVKEYAEVYTRRPSEYWKYMNEFVAAHDVLRGCGKATIARVNGVVAGGGNEFHMACDLSVAADHAEFLQVGTKVGSVAAGGATQWLPLLIGDRRAREMLLLCEKVDAKKALDWGLVNQVVPASELDAAVRALAEKLIDKFPESTRYTKEQVNFWKDLAWHQTVGHARDWLSVHFATQEPFEGMRAFVEKREARPRKMREERAGGGSPEYLWGPPAKTCSSCHAAGIPEGFAFCGKCGAKLG